MFAARNLRVDKADGLDAGNDLPQVGQQHDDEDTKDPGEEDAPLPLARHFLAEAKHALHQPLEAALHATRQELFAAREEEEEDEDEDSVYDGKQQGTGKRERANVEQWLD